MEKKSFKNLVRKHIEDEQKQKRILDSSLTFRQKLKRLGTELSDKDGLVSLLAEAVRLMI